MKTVILLIATLFTLQAHAQLLGSLDFNGTDNFVEIANSPMNIIGTGDFTLEAWIKGDEQQQTNHPMIFSNRGENSFGGGVALFFHDQWGSSQSKMLCFQIDAVNYLNIDNGSFNGSLLDNECHHIAVARKDTELSFYVDGIIIGKKEIPSSLTVNFDGPLLIGKDRATNNTFNGLISQSRIWNVARSETDLFENKDISLSGSESGLIAYWEMNDETGQLVVDKTGEYNGQLGNDNQADNQDPLWSLEGCVEAVPTSTSDLKINPVIIYPNPTLDFVTIENLNSDQLQFKLMDQAGKLIATDMTNDEFIQINLSKYPGGIYFLNLISNGVSQTEKIIKQ